MKNSLEIFAQRISREEVTPDFKVKETPERIFETLKVSYQSMVAAKSGQLISPDEALMEKLKMVSVWLSGGGKPHLILYGSYGLGKTTMLKAIYHTLCFYRRCIPIFILSSRVNELNKDVRNEMKTNKTYLIIDEFGREKDTVTEYGNVQEPMKDIICYREMTGIPLVLASNLTDEEIEKKYGKYIYDRLAGSFSWLFYEGESFRITNRNNL